MSTPNGRLGRDRVFYVGLKNRRKKQVSYRVILINLMTSNFGKLYKEELQNGD